MRTARAAPLCLTARGTHGLLQLHRRLLQSHPAALRPRVSLAHLLRTGDANRPTARYPLTRPRKRGNFTERPGCDGAVLIGGDVVAAEMKQVVDLIRGGEEALRLAG